MWKKHWASWTTFAAEPEYVNWWRLISQAIWLYRNGWKANVSLNYGEKGTAIAMHADGWPPLITLRPVYVKGWMLSRRRTPVSKSSTSVWRLTSLFNGRTVCILCLSLRVKCMLIRSWSSPPSINLIKNKHIWNNLYINRWYWEVCWQLLPVVTQSMNLINYFRRSTIRFFTWNTMASRKWIWIRWKRPLYIVSMWSKPEVTLLWRPMWNCQWWASRK